DYPHVTENARIYFEDIEEWDHAIELVMNEALRTKSTFWMDILAGYVERGLTVTYEPAYFSELLEALYHLDRVRFERFVEILWQSYRKSNVYLEWIDVLNASLHEMESDRKSTRLNSSHVSISYAVFCLKKKTKKQPANITA